MRHEAINILASLFQIADMNLSLTFKHIMLPSVRRNVNVLIEAGGFYSSKYGRFHARKWRLRVKVAVLEIYT